MSTGTQNPVALITGAAGGIGLATVSLLRSRGCRVVAADLRLAELPCTDPDLMSQTLDVTDEAAIARVVARGLAEFGRIDHVVHLAGQTGTGPLIEVSRADWDRLLAVNLTSAFLLAKAVAQALVVSRGTLTLTASTNGLNGGSALSGPAYAVAKAGIINLMRYLAKEWAPQGVRVNALAPGPIATPMVTGKFTADQQAAIKANVLLRRFGTAAEVAAAIGYLTSTDAAYVTGTVMNVSGGAVLD
jgi:NAD(P)-dependent dehydrogenase (short-subunit alcohol dehydrogenase family)